MGSWDEDLLVEVAAGAFLLQYAGSSNANQFIGVCVNGVRAFLRGLYLLGLDRFHGIHLDNSMCLVEVEWLLVLGLELL